jgi:type II secretory pathway component PulC
MMADVLLPMVATDSGRRLGYSGMVLLTILLCAEIVTSVLQWRDDAMFLTSVSVTHAIPSHDDLLQRVAAIPRQHLFGQDQTVGPTEGLPITSMAIKLTGVIKVSHGQQLRSRAMLSETDQPSKVYEVGDTLSSGVKLYAIHDNEVIFDNGGQLERLPMQRAPLLFQGMPKPLWQRN